MSKIEQFPLSTGTNPEQKNTAEIKPAGGETEPELRETAREITASDKGIINKVRKWLNSKVAETPFPTKEGLGYESTMRTYGGKLVKDVEGKMVWDTTGFWSKIDKWGDRILRAFDEHHARKPGAMFLRRPGAFIKLLPFLVDSKRYRGTPEQTMENVKRLGLEDYYGPHPKGIEVKDPKLFSNSIGLQDIFRQDQINHPALNDIDRFEALGTASDYMHTLHENAGGIGEANAFAFLFTEKKDGKVGKPILTIPTEVYNPQKEISEVEKKATDLLDLLASAATEEYRRSQNWEGVQKALGTVLEHYENTKVIGMAESYVKRGRLTLLGDIEGLDFETSPTYRMSRGVFAAHNTQRLSVKNPEATAQLRDEIVNACERFLETANKDTPSENPIE